MCLSISFKGVLKIFLLVQEIDYINPVHSLLTSKLWMLQKSCADFYSASVTQNVKIKSGNITFHMYFER